MKSYLILFSEVLRSYSSVLMVLAILFSHELSYSQTIPTLGTKIIGEAERDECGFSVALSGNGNRVVIGSNENDGFAPRAGHVRVFEWQDSAWVQIGSDIDGQATVDWFGHSVDISDDGNRIAAGARYNDGSFVDAGNARVFDWDGNTWNQVGSDIEGEIQGDESGYSISLSGDGNTIAIGSPEKNRDGAVRVYSWDGAEWGKMGSDIDGVNRLSGQFGRIVSISSNGNRLAVGDPTFGASNIGRDKGLVQVYDWNNIDSTWEQTGDDIIGDTTDYLSGFSLSLSGDGNYLVVGEPGAQAFAGQIRVFEWKDSSWAQMGTPIIGEGSGDYAGWSVSIPNNGQKIVFGAPENRGGIGHVRIFEWDGMDWVQEGADIDDDEIALKSGKSVAFSGDGNRLAVGAPDARDLGFKTGHVYVYGLSGMNTSTNFLSTSYYSFDRIYPNPASTKTRISYTLEQAGPVEIYIHDTMGKLISEIKEYGQQGENSLDFNVSRLAGGIYHISLQHEKQVLSQKLIVNSKF